MIMNIGTWRPTLSGYLFEIFKGKWKGAIEILTGLSERTTITIEATSSPSEKSETAPTGYVFLRGSPEASVTHLSVNFIETVHIDGCWHILGYFCGSDESNWIGQWNFNTQCFCLCPASVLHCRAPLNPHEEVLVYQEVLVYNRTHNPSNSTPIKKMCGPIFLHPKLKCPVRYIHTDTPKGPSEIDDLQLVWWTKCPIARDGVWLRKKI